MKNTKLLKISLTATLFFVTLVGLTQTPDIYFLGGSGWQQYCSNAVPGGTFALTLNNGKCDEWDTWGWVNITGDGCDGTNPKTVYISYPSTTTTYECVVNMTYHYYFTIIVDQVPATQSLSGSNCCIYYGTVTVNNTETGVRYWLYKNGVDQSSYRDGSTGNSVSWTNQPTGTYTVKAYRNGICPVWMSGSVVISRTCCKGEKGNSEDLNKIDDYLRIYPNPNNGNFIFECDIIGTYLICNEIGQEIKYIEITQNVNKIEVSGLPKGMYYIRNLNNTKGLNLKFSVLSE
jgi:hypothetical protein